MYAIFKKLVATALFSLIACAVAVLYGCGPSQIRLDSGETTDVWDQARYFQAQGRYDLAREHFLLALAAARTNEERRALNQELQTVDLQIQTLR